VTALFRRRWQFSSEAYYPSGGNHRSVQGEPKVKHDCWAGGGFSANYDRAEIGIILYGSKATPISLNNSSRDESEVFPTTGVIDEICWLPAFA